MSANRQTSKLGAFGKLGSKKPEKEALEVRRTTGGRGRTNPDSPVVNVSLRLSRGDWLRVHELARNEGTSINALAILGLSKCLQERGLAPLKGLT